jgi:hypothetical protein
MRQRRLRPVYVDMSARLFLASVLFLLGGCTPSPAETCQRLEDLAAKDPAGFKLSTAKCLARMNEMKERDGDAYKCAARTVAKLPNIETALLAVSVCDAGKRTHDE